MKVDLYTVLRIMQLFLPAQGGLGKCESSGVLIQFGRIKKS